MARRDLLIVGLLPIAVILAVWIAGRDDELAAMSGPELTAHVRERGPKLRGALKRIVPYAREDAGACDAIVLALAAGPSVPIYAPASRALAEVGNEAAIPALFRGLQHEDLWIVRYSVIMLGRLAEPDSGGARKIESMRGSYTASSGTHHLRTAIEEAWRAIESRR